MLTGYGAGQARTMECKSAVSQTREFREPFIFEATLANLQIEVDLEKMVCESLGKGIAG